MTTVWTSTTMTLSSTTVASFLANTSITLEVQVTFNCGTPVVINITNANQGTYIANGNVVLVPANVNQTGTFQSGVYKVRLTYKANTAQIDTGLVYVDTGIACKLVDHASTHLDCLDKPCEENFLFWAFGFHYVLKDLKYCNESSYIGACKLYNTMSEILENVVDCGC